MLSAEEESALLASLRFREDELWLKGMYRGRLHKYDVSVVQPLSLSAEDDIMDHNGGAVQAAEAAETRVRALDRARAIFANRYLSRHADCGGLCLPACLRCADTLVVWVLPMTWHVQYVCVCISSYVFSVDAKTIMAEFHYYHNDFVRCHEVTEAILARDSFAHPCLGNFDSSALHVATVRSHVARSSPS